jgi:hypothetical protein
MLQGRWTYVLNIMLIILNSSIVISTLGAVTYVIFTYPLPTLAGAGISEQRVPILVATNGSHSLK